MDNQPVLYIAATPIGNMEDITYRTVRILKEEVSAIFCEDTRQSGKLLKNYNIDQQTFSLHAHSHENSIKKALSYLENGDSIAYISDCGTPGISDPGAKLCDSAAKNGFKISPLPGASALTSIVSISGFPGKTVLFAGFISKKPGRRINELTKLSEQKATIVIYESPHRILKTLSAIQEVFPAKNILIARELTKLYEEIIRINSDSMQETMDTLICKGEFCIAIDNN